MRYQHFLMSSIARNGFPGPWLVYMCSLCQGSVCQWSPTPRWFENWIRHFVIVMHWPSVVCWNQRERKISAFVMTWVGWDLARLYLDQIFLKFWQWDMIELKYPILAWHDCMVNQDNRFWSDPRFILTTSNFHLLPSLALSEPTQSWLYPDFFLSLHIDKVRPVV